MFSNLIESVTNIGVPTDSLQSFKENLSVSSVVIAILAVFVCIGLVDKLRGNKLGYGERLDAGFQAMDDLALAIVAKLSGGILAVLRALFLLKKGIIIAENR